MHKKNKGLPLVSIIIPTFNEAKYILKCIKSLQHQTYSNLEIIVVDDGSTDSTKNILSGVSVKSYTITHRGPGRARNYGVMKTQGSILVFVDADMYVEHDFIEKITKPIINNKYIGTYTLSEYIANKNNLWSICWNINNNLPINRRISPNDQNQGRVFRAITRDVFKKYKGFNPSKGYFDDQTFSDLGLIAYPVTDAICYHFNPDSLVDVFFSARWIGRSPEFNKNINNFIKYSFINSLIFSVKKIINGAPLAFIIFKAIFDIGIIVGMIQKRPMLNYSK